MVYPEKKRNPSLSKSFTMKFVKNVINWKEFFYISDGKLIFLENWTFYEDT